MPLISGLTDAREQLFLQPRYDIAVMQAVTEHVRDPESLMAAIAGALRPEPGPAWMICAVSQSVTSPCMTGPRFPNRAPF